MNSTQPTFAQALASLDYPVIAPRFERFVAAAGGLNEPTLHARLADVEFLGHAQGHPLFRALPCVVVSIATDAEVLRDEVGWVVHLFGAN